MCSLHPHAPDFFLPTEKMEGRVLLARPFRILGLWLFRKSYYPPSPLSSLAHPIKSSPAHTLPLCTGFHVSLLRMGVSLCIRRRPECPWLRREPERTRALGSSPEHIYTFQGFVWSPPQPWVLPSNQLANCNCTSLYNNEHPSRSTLPSQHLIGGVDRERRLAKFFPGKDGERMGAVGVRTCVHR